MKELAFSNLWYWLLLGAVVSYFVGCFNFAVIISRFKKKDIRDQGSGNPGSLNMARTFGLGIGFLNLFCDCLKGAIPVLCGYLIFKNYQFAGTGVAVSDFTRYFFGVFVIIGHIFPVTMKFKGGKGIASTVGIFWCGLSCEYWWFCFIGLGAIALAFLYIYIFEWGSMGSLLIVSGLTIVQAVFFVTRYTGALSGVWVIMSLMMLLALNILTWTAHRKNLYLLMCGEEHHTSLGRHKRPV
ncbi:MAG: glycerol-3-phosphate acyltransferase [Clostridia bacterium]|nr:glycerol-3-phosphate acyltransferase [Clostridia bacterium]